MSKARAKLIEERRRQIAAMDTIMGAVNDRSAVAGWTSIVRDYHETASDDGRYEECCRYFKQIIINTEWMITNEN